jgi:addiction module RelE/StbE family toxin
MKIKRVEYSKKFIKLLKKVPKKKQDKALQAIDLLLADPTDSRLRLHKLSGQFVDVYSISAGGDLRLHFEFVIVDDLALFIDIGTHSQLYK